MVWILFLAMSVSHAADTLESMVVNNLTDLQKCYTIRPYHLSVTDKNKKTETFIDDVEIQRGCSAKANDFALSIKGDSSTLFAISKEVQKNHRIEESLKIFKILVENDHNLKSCDDMNLFKAIKAGLSRPENYPNSFDSDVVKVYKVIEPCLKNAQFSKDIQEETKSTNIYVSRNICTFFKTKKINSNCK